eukprot:scaffold128102_cov56-Phaeocystis_antarctica.AAC.2
MVERRMAYLDVRLDDADRLGLSLLEGAPLRPHLDHADVVPFLIVQDADCLPLGQCREGAQGLLEHGLRLDEAPLLDGRALEVHDVAFVEVHVLHHPKGEVDHALLYASP